MENLENTGAAGEMVSVVVPVRDRAEIVCRTLESIENQTYRPIHLIVVDNGSRDETLRVVSDWKYAHEAEGFKITILLESTPGACHGGLRFKPRGEDSTLEGTTQRPSRRRTPQPFHH